MVISLLHPPPPPTRWLSTKIHIAWDFCLIFARIFVIGRELDTVPPRVHQVGSIWPHCRTLDVHPIRVERRIRRNCGYYFFCCINFDELFKRVALARGKKDGLGLRINSHNKSAMYLWPSFLNTGGGTEIVYVVNACRGDRSVFRSIGISCVFIGMYNTTCLSCSQ